MRFKQFLTEDTSLFEKDIERIKKSCQPFLTESAGKMLWRGLPKVSVSNGKKTEMSVTKLHKFAHPKDRVPKHTNTAINFFFNAGCEMAFGVKDIRKQSIFASGSPSQAIAYGAPFLIFPIGKFKYISSRLINDSIDTAAITSKIAASLDKSADEVLNNFNTLASEIHPHDWVLNPRVETDLFSAEVNAACAQALGRVYSDMYQNSELAALIVKKNEILIYESRGYYALPISAVIEEMKKHGETDIKDDDGRRINAFLKKFW